ncbi:hypothetical protein Tco_1561146 [Tanacetum coccineum]
MTSWNKCSWQAVHLSNDFLIITVQNSEFKTIAMNVSSSKLVRNWRDPSESNPAKRPCESNAGKSFSESNDGKRGSGSSNVKRPSGSNKGKRPIVIEDDDGSDSSEYSGDSEDSVDKENGEWMILIRRKFKFHPPFVMQEVDLKNLVVENRSIGKCTASFLSKEIEEAIKPDPRVQLFIEGPIWQRKYELGLSDMKIFRAKQMAEERLFGDWAKQYAQLRQYALEFEDENNPETKFKIDVEKMF